MQAKYIAILITSVLLIFAVALGLNKALTGFLTLPTGNIIAERAIDIPLPNLTDNTTNTTNETNETNQTNTTNITNETNISIPSQSVVSSGEAVKQEDAQNKIAEAKREIFELEQEISMSGTSDQNILTLRDNAKANLANAQTALDNKDYGEAFGQANSALQHAKNAITALVNGGIILNQNPSFEQPRADSDLIPANWFWTDWSNKNDDVGSWSTEFVFLDKQVKRSGNFSLAHTENSHGNGFTIKTLNFPILQGKTYHVQLFAQTNATGVNGVPEVSWVQFDKDGNSLLQGQQGIEFNKTTAWEVNFCLPLCGGLTTNISSSIDTDGWMRISFDFMPLPNADHAALYVDMLGEGISLGQWFIDDLRVWWS